MRTLIEVLGDRIIGVVEEVSASGISVLLDPSSPHATALNAGMPGGFPRINGYLLVPNETGATVGIITQVKIARLPYPKRRGMQDFGLVDLPFPARIVSLTPLGTLLSSPGESIGDLVFHVRRGVDVFPSVGDPVLLPTHEQLRAIVEGESAGNPKRVLVGTCPTAGGAPVHVDPDKLFGRHLAVLGNTGAGKSCSVAGLIRWSLEAARTSRGMVGGGGGPNARFIILDPNGEYAKAFRDFNPRVFQVEYRKAGPARPLKVPAWLWNGEEWAAFTGAAPGVQRPILFDAIRRLRSQVDLPDAFQTKVGHHVRNYHDRLRLIFVSGRYMGFPGCMECAAVLVNVCRVFQHLADDPNCSDANLRRALQAVVTASMDAETAARSYIDKKDGKQRYNDIDGVLLEKVINALDHLAESLGILEEPGTIGEDVPQHFSIARLPEYVEALATDVTGRDMAQFVDSLNLRIHRLFAAGTLASVLDAAEERSISLDEWLTDHIGGDQAANGAITIIDLSLLPSEVIHIIVSVLARMVFEAIQHYRRLYGEVLPTVLVLEEAHTFIHRDLSGDTAPSAARICCKTFERIAREGRKFGLGLVLASQRPAEVSETVLSQCNTFLLHRIVNDRDQNLVRRLVPDGLGDLLRDLPSLPSRRAILLGWGAPAPVLVEIGELREDTRPQSPDPDFWDVWTGKRPCEVDWKLIADSWTRSPASSTTADRDQHAAAGSSDNTRVGTDPRVHAGADSEEDLLEDFL